MKLYSGGIAPNPRRVSIFLAEKNIEIETKQFDIARLEQKGEELTKINARQRLPVLELDDGTIITETVAICRYIEEFYPVPLLMGIDPLDRAIVEMWQRRMELELFMPVGFAFRHLHPAAADLEPIQVREWGELNQGFAKKAMKNLDEELGNRQFIAGDRFTIADITAFCAYLFLKPGRIDYPMELSNLQRWFGEMKDRPSTQL
ncbi:MAG: glutathione S-transferase family protein [Hyphomicrobiales bacterium]|nr:glutathione S-transferase family protein [Hyphomicrobiales bacterium]